MTINDKVRISSLRTGIKIVLKDLEPSYLSPEQTIMLAKKSLTVLLDSDLDKSLGVKNEHR